MSYELFNIAGSLTQAIRNFAKSLENWLKGAMTTVPEEMQKTKVGHAYIHPGHRLLSMPVCDVYL